MQTSLPSPLPFLVQVPDPRNPDRVEHSWETFWVLILLAIAARQENVLAISQWLEDQSQWLLSTVGIRTRHGQAKLPSQASLYRFLWSVEHQHTALEQQLTAWSAAVIPARRRDNALLLGVSIDGKHLRGTARPEAGESALVLCSAFLGSLGLTLTQALVETSEAQTARACIPNLKTLLPKGQWLLTGDAAFTEAGVAQAVLQAGGDYLLQVKANQRQTLEMLSWVFEYPPAREDSQYQDEERRSGQQWSWHLQASFALPDEVRDRFPGAQQALRLQRQVVELATGEVRSEVAYALSSSSLPAKELYLFWRGHWGIENRLHHKRDVVFREDDCRTRKAGQTLAAVRNLILGLLHLRGEKVLRMVRRFNAQPHLLLDFLGLQS